jgi:hypothetical protein
LKLAKGEWAEQGWVWLVGSLVLAVLWGPDLSPVAAMTLLPLPFLVGLLLLLQVRWAPEFLLLVAAVSFMGLVYFIFDRGFSLGRVLGLLCVMPGVIYPYRLLRASRPGLPAAAEPDRNEGAESWDVN